MGKLSDKIGPFTAIPNSVYARAAELGPAAILVYLHLSYRKGDNNTCWPGYDEIQEYTRLGRKTISEALKKLEKCGLIEKRRRFGNSTVYELMPISSTQNYSSEENDAPLVPQETPLVPQETPLVPQGHANKNQLTRFNEQDVESNPVKPADNDIPHHLRLSDAFTRVAKMAYFGNDTDWIEACEDMSKAGIQEADIEAAVKHCLDKGYTIRGPRSVMKSANIEMAKRLNGKNGNKPVETKAVEVYQ